jgi:hypothetical protein
MRNSQARRTVHFIISDFRDYKSSRRTGKRANIKVQINRKGKKTGEKFHLILL